METEGNDEGPQDLQTAALRISCDDDGALQVHAPDGSAVDAPLRDAAIAENRMAIVDLLERTASASQGLLRLGDAAPPAVFRQRANGAAPAADAEDPPEPLEPDPPKMPRRRIVHWLLPPLWRPVREKVTKDHLQARQIYLWQHEAWRKDMASRLAERSAVQAQTRAANRADEARFLQRQLRIVKGSDVASVRASFEDQLKASPWAAALQVDARIAEDCRSAALTIEMPSIDAFEAFCPPPCAVDPRALRLVYDALTPRELKRRYDLYVMASTLKTAAAAFVAMPTVMRVAVVAEHSVIADAKRFMLAQLSLTREAWAQGWQKPDAPMHELNRLRGKFSLSPRAVPITY